MRIRLRFAPQYPHPIRATKEWAGEIRDWWGTSSTVKRVAVILFAIVIVLLLGLEEPHP